MARKFKAFLASTALLLASCGGGGGGGGPPVPVNTAPAITSGGTATVAENTTGTVYQATATDAEGNAVTFSLAGTDAARFAITPAGAISFVAPPDFEAPADSGANNVYDLLLIASDGTLTSQIALTITVTNLPDAAAVRQVATDYVGPRQVVGIPGSTNLFVIERRGNIFLLDPAVAGRGTLFMTVGNIGTFDSFGTGGLLSIVPAPNYATSGIFYLSVTDPAGVVEVRRYTRSSPTTGDSSSGDVILRIPNVFRSLTALDALLFFGPDGMLYILTGENGNRLGPQDPADLRGKVLRIDVGSDAFPADPLRDYAIPADNPNLGAGVSEAVARGLYDPQGAGFNGPDLLFGDIDPGGAGEINLMRQQDRGANYGWPTPQLNPTPPGITPAVIQTFFGMSATAGPVYRGSLVPLRGSFLYAVSRTGVYAIPPSQLVQGTQVTGTLRPDLSPPPAANGPIIISFTEDSQGDVYYLNLTGANGDVYKIEAR